MEIKTKAEGRVLTVRLQGELDHHGARELMEGLDRLIEQNLPTEDLLTPILAPYQHLDALVLGCTHYPFAADTIKKLLPNTQLFDGGPGTARQTQRLLAQQDLLNPGPGEVTYL